ncbi:hypothetical protein [Paenibacillus senegalensis]|uniref:hypothetical protein n=1 Tax=Paenibacillus senegalensis TaxID=1465766 RepID=UPI000287AF6C|nr:hypothetical protein [Paenibacillus senegalensis]
MNKNNERRKAEEGLGRFKEETGFDFFDLMSNKQTRAKMLVNGSRNKDTDEDEETLQKTFGPLQSKCW